MAVSISLAGKNAIITGAGSGMGRCTALMLAEAGTNILVSDINIAGIFGSVDFLDCTEEE